MTIPRGWRFASIPAAIIESTSLGPCEKLVVAAILFHVWNGGECWPSRKRLALLTSFSERKVWDGVLNLKKAGILKVTEREGKSHLYEFLHPGTTCQGQDDTPASGVGDSGATCRTTSAPRADEVEVVNEKYEREEDAKKKSLLSDIKSFTDAWVKEYPEAHATIKDGVKQTAPYSFAGSKDRQSAERIVKACQACDPQVDPMDLARFVWTHPKYARGKGFLGAMGKSIAVLSSGINEALGDFRARGSAGRHAPVEDYEGRASDAKA